MIIHRQNIDITTKYSYAGGGGGGGGGSCFPLLAKVNIENGDSVTMSELHVGHKVQTGKSIKI